MGLLDDFIGGSENTSKRKAKVTEDVEVFYDEKLGKWMTTAYSYPDKRSNSKSKATTKARTIARKNPGGAVVKIYKKNGELQDRKRL